ncbi:MAG: transcriptional regulator [Cellvibrionaceae bacterium]|nr:transcriptional regulator [Cellvibrionaceae bacterium]|tara:strand:+ start:1727 stop:2206 length:480 start_codon:yes stop_codon:yes gene_type:complete
MKHTSFEDMNCSIAQSMEVIGERWSLLIIRDCFEGLRRFGQFQRKLGIAKNILSNRLNRLVEEEVLEKRPIDDGAQQEYVLTQKGFDLYPVLMSLMMWGDKYKANPKGTRVYFVDNETEQPIQGLRIVGANGDVLEADQVKQVAGPALGGKKIRKARKT